METLINAGIVIIVLAVLLVLVTGASHLLEKYTGRDLGQWGTTLAIGAFGLLVGRGGIWLIQYSMEKEQVFGVLVGLVVILIGIGILFAAWGSNKQSSYNAMSEKRAHYDKTGKLTGYSDRD